jgi:hypothetical protein
VDGDAVACRQVARHVVAQVLRRGDREALGAGQPAVGRLQVGGRHAEARVDHRQRVRAVAGRPLVALAAPDVDRLVGRREHQRVLDQLGQEVGQVGGDRAEDRRRLDAPDRHPLVVLDLAECGADDVGEPHRRRPLPGRVEAGQDEQ